MVTSDEECWQAALRGDGEGFGVVFDRHRARVFRHAAVLGLAADADDVVAVTFLEAWRSRGRVRFVDGSMLPWLLRTATYTAANVRRATRRYRAALNRLPPFAPASPFEQSEAENALADAPLTDRQVITLCVLEGLSTREAANVLGIKEGTVKSRLSRAKQRLRERLAAGEAPRLEGVADV